MYGELYEQVDGVAMGSPLDPTVTNIFLFPYEHIWRRDCLLECNPSYYTRYVDNIFVVFESETQVELSLNICYPKMKFTFKREQNKSFNF